MTTEDLIIENTAMLRVLLKNQIQMVTMMTEMIDRMSNGVTVEERAEWRQQLLDVQLQLAQVEVANQRDKIKLAQYGAYPGQ